MLKSFWKKLDSFIASFGLSIEKLAQVGHSAVTYGLVFTAFVIGGKHGLSCVGWIVTGFYLLGVGLAILAYYMGVR